HGERFRHRSENLQERQAPSSEKKSASRGLMDALEILLHAVFHILGNVVAPNEELDLSLELAFPGRAAAARDALSVVSRLNRSVAWSLAFDSPHLGHLPCIALETPALPLRLNTAGADTFSLPLAHALS